MTRLDASREGGSASPFEFSMRRPVPADEAEILSLLRGTVGETAASKKTADFWRWKHEHSPFGPSYSVCACAPAGPSERERIAGLRTLMWWSFGDPTGGRLRAARAVDTATHPDFQRRGIFSRLTRRAIEELQREGAAFIFNTPNDQSLPGYLKMGWETVARWPVYVRPVHWIKSPVKLMAGRVRAGRRLGPLPHPGAPLTTWSRFYERQKDALGELISAHESRRRTVGYRTVRTSDYLDWRYGQHPDVEYWVLSVPSGGGLEGAVIGRPVWGSGGLPAFAVTEMFVRDPDEAHCGRLLQSLLRATVCDYVMAYFAAGTAERSALSRSGFFRAPGRGYTFVSLPLGPAELDPTREDSWDLTLGELEIF